MFSTQQDTHQQILIIYISITYTDTRTIRKSSDRDNRKKLDNKQQDNGISVIILPFYHFRGSD